MKEATDTLAPVEKKRVRYFSAKPPSITSGPVTEYCLVPRNELKCFYPQYFIDDLNHADLARNGANRVVEAEKTLW